MTTPDITTTPGAGGDQVISLPSAVPNATSDTTDVPPRGPERSFQGIDFALIGVVLLFAFLAASFVETGRDLWLHLATGRALAAGEYHFGSDPFAYTSEGIYWANPSWLSDWLLYVLHGALGGSGLVLLKALLIMALAWVLLQIRNRSGNVSVPVVCTALALLVMSPRLTLQPVVVSYLFLGVTLWLLRRPGGTTKATFRQQLKHFAPLLVLIALWANLDGWFLLGPALAGLFWLGERLQVLFSSDTVDGTRRTARVPAWLVPATVAACLVNPHHVHIFAPPLELSPVLWTAELAQDVRFHELVAPVSRLNLRVWPIGAINLAEWGYVALLLVGLVSFLLNRRHRSGWRLLVWVSFAVLSLCRMRTVPFFAVVAGPITALELQDFLWNLKKSTRSLSPNSKFQIPNSKVVLLTAGFALLVLTWFGWLQGTDRVARRPAWGVQPDPSLQRVAETIRRWREEGKLTASDRAFPIHPDVANYLVWFCPGEKVFLDGRLALSAETSSAYETVCQELAPGVDQPEDEELKPDYFTSEWRTIFRARGITCLIVYDPDAQVFLRMMARLSGDEQWTLLHVDGQALLYGWRGARDFAGLTFDPNRLAFGPPDDRDLPPAPGAGPGREPRVQPEWTHRGRPGPAPTWESAAATTFARSFEDRARDSFLRSSKRSWIIDQVSVTVLPALPAGPAATATTVAVRLRLFSRVGRPPTLPLLAVRAARRALSANPNDANAYLRLGQAYRLLSTQTAEPVLGPYLGPLAVLRHVQAASALERALVLNHDLKEAHKLLGDLYEQQGFLDASLEHRRQELRLRRAVRHGPRDSPERFARELKRLERRVDEQEKMVQDAQNKLLTQSRPDDKPFDKARRALKLGLGRQALDNILLPSQGLRLGPGGVTLQIELALKLGRAAMAREMLEHEEVQKVKDSLGTAFGHLSVHEWLLVCVQAADGNYEQADGLLRAVLLALDREATRSRRELQRALSLRGLEADLNVVLAVLALEWGEPARAAASLQRALALSSKGGEAEATCAGRHLAVFYLECLKAARKAH